MNIPIVLIIYNRADQTKAVFASIKQARPQKLYVIADGPKDTEDKVKCESSREVVQVDWPCEVIKLYANTNQGLRHRVVSGLTEVFKREEFAIILEDDCVADASFYRFTEQMLKKYANDERIISIAGFNGCPQVRIGSSYTFSKYVESWGWASWRRAWKVYDDQLTGWQEQQQTRWLEDYVGGKLISLYWRAVFNLTQSEKLKTWAYRWEYSAWRNNGLTIVPKTNLIENIGFGREATNTKRKLKLPPVVPLRFPLKHPKRIKVNVTRDERVNQSLLWNASSLYLILKELVRKI